MGSVTKDGVGTVGCFDGLVSNTHELYRVCLFHVGITQRAFDAGKLSGRKGLLALNIAKHTLHEIEQSLCQAVIAANGAADEFADFTDARWTAKERPPLKYRLDTGVILEVQFTGSDPDSGDPRPVLIVR